MKIYFNGRVVGGLSTKRVRLLNKSLIDLKITNSTCILPKKFLRFRQISDGYHNFHSHVQNCIYFIWLWKPSRNLKGALELKGGYDEVGNVNPAHQKKLFCQHLNCKH